MADSPVLVVGLGNPGREYATTRHNLGWMALDELMGLGGFATPKKKFQGEYTRGTLEGRDVILLRPETYMNESGRSVQPAASFFHAAPRDIIVLHDELDIPFGDVRVKLGGGHAGHNGLRSMVQHLGTAEFVRVRLGVGRPPAGFGGEVADFLLSSFTPVERAMVPDIVTKGVAALRKILAIGVERAMNEANTRPKQPGRAGSGGAGSEGQTGGSAPRKNSGGGQSASSRARGPEGRTQPGDSFPLLAPGQSSPGP